MLAKSGFLRPPVNAVTGLLSVGFFSIGFLSWLVVESKCLKEIPFWTAGEGRTFCTGAGVLVPGVLPFSTLPSSCSPFISYFFPAPLLSALT